jgi:antitoxin component YwqK of YwqJK toxin-antitoxin module
MTSPLSIEYITYQNNIKNGIYKQYNNKDELVVSGEYKNEKFTG